MLNLSMLSITRELLKLASLALLLLAALVKHFALLILHFNRLLMKRIVGSSSESWAILAVGLVWILGGIVLVVLVVLLSLGWLRL
jgi:hypothetical protein